MNVKSERTSTKQVNKNHPPIEIINQIRQELSAPDYPYKNIGLKENSSAEEKFKYEICQAIVRYQRENNLSGKELGQRINATAQQVHAIVYGWIDCLGLEQLINYLEKLHLPFQVKIISQEARV